MAQTKLDYNNLMFATSDTTYVYKKGTILAGAADLIKGQVVVLDAGKYRPAVDADKTNVSSGWRILLADAAVTGGDVEAPTGVRGGVYSGKLVGAGLTVDDALFNILEANNIFVQDGTDSIQVAGEGV